MDRIDFNFCFLSLFLQQSAPVQCRDLQAVLEVEPHLPKQLQDSVPIIGRDAGMLRTYIQQAEEKSLTIAQRIAHQCAYCVSFNGSKMSWGLISCESFHGF